MLPKRIILVRHGQSEGNVDKGIYVSKPDWKLELTDKGKQEAFEAGKKIIRVFLMRFFHCTPEYFHEIRNPHNGEFIIFERESETKYFRLKSKLRLRDKDNE